MIEKTVAEIIAMCTHHAKTPGCHTETLFNEFDMDEYHFYEIPDFWKICDRHFSHVAFDTWTCWDTPVGKNLIYFNEEPIAITVQTARKSTVEWYWLGKENPIKVREFLLSLQTDYEYKRITYISGDTVVALEGDDIGDSRSMWNKRFGK